MSTLPSQAPEPGSDGIHPRPPTPAPPTRPAGSSNLALRLVTAAVVVPAVIYTIWVGGLLYLAVIMGIVLLGLREFYGLIEDKGAHPLVGFGLAAGVAIPVVAYVGNEYHATILMTATLLAVMVAQVGKAQITEALASISGTFFGVFYVGWLLSHAVVLRQFHDVVSAKWGTAAAASISPDAGVFYMFYTVSTVVMCDVGAYFGGRAWGRRKLAPQISPSKTVEGALSGIGVGVCAGLVTKGVFDLAWPSMSRDFSWLAALLFGLVLSIVGIIGDLVESLLKRDARVKDTGSLLPGMGGVLDRIDSNLLAIPVMYYGLLAYTYLRVG
jgi:phosphatidate cytidylyltransferase